MKQLNAFKYKRSKKLDSLDQVNSLKRKRLNGNQDEFFIENVESDDESKPKRIGNSIEDSKLSSYDRDEFFIENIESDDESKGPRRIGLCIQDGNQLIVNLKRNKRRKSESSDNLDQSSERLIYYNSKNNSDYLNRTSDISIAANKSKTKSNLIDSPSHFKSNNTEPPLSHSTPKVGLRVQKKLEQIENDFSPFKRKANNSNDRRTIDSPKTPLKTISKNTIDQSRYSRKSPQTTPKKPISISQQISTPQSPEVSYKLRRPKVKLANQSLRQFKVNSNQKKKRTPVTLKNDCKTLVPYDAGHINVINDNKTKRSNLNDNDNDKVNLTPVKSQYISQTESPAKNSGPSVKESRNFLRLSKKMNKLIQQHNLAKFKSKANRSSIVQADKPLSILSSLFEVVYTESESRKHWLSMMKNDEVKRDSLYLKLTNVKSSRNGFVDCDCIVDVDKMKEVFDFKYENLKTLIPTRFANDYEVSSDAVLEYLSPWSTYDSKVLKTTFIINPFWIHIIDHGVPESPEDSVYEVIYSNPNKDQFL